MEPNPITPTFAFAIAVPRVVDMCGEDYRVASRLIMLHDTARCAKSARM